MTSPRPSNDTRAETGRVIALASVSMFFAAALFVWTYVRLSAPAWPPAGAPRLPRVLPALAVALMVLGAHVAQRGVVLVLGSGVVVLLGFLMSGLWRAGWSPASVGVPGAALLGLLGALALHVAVATVGRTLGGQRGWVGYWKLLGVVSAVSLGAVFLA